MDDNKNDRKKISVDIAGMSYNLISNKPEEYVKNIASIADESIKNLTKNSPNLSTAQATVLALVNFIESAKTVNDKFILEQKNLTQAQRKFEEAKKDLDKQRDENFELKKEILRVNELNKHLELEIGKLRQTEISSESENIVDDFLEDVKNPFNDEDSDYKEDEVIDENDFHPLKQQSFDEI